MQPKLWMLIVLLSMAPQAAAHAEMRLAGNQATSHIEIDDSPDVAVLQGLAQHYGFDVKGIENVSGEDISLDTCSGSLKVVLRRLLRNRNHMIVHASDNSIKQVLILDAKVGTKSTHAKRAPAPRPDADADADAFHGAFLAPAHTETRTALLVASP